MVYEVQIIAIPLIIIGVLMIAIGIALYLAPLLSNIFSSLNIPDPIKNILLVKTRIGTIDIYTSPVIIAILLALYLILIARR